MRWLAAEPCLRATLASSAQIQARQASFHLSNDDNNIRALPCSCAAYATSNIIILHYYWLLLKSSHTPFYSNPFFSSSNHTLKSEQTIDLNYIFHSSSFQQSTVLESTRPKVTMAIIPRYPKSVALHKPSSDLWSRLCSHHINAGF